MYNQLRRTTNEWFNRNGADTEASINTFEDAGYSNSCDGNNVPAESRTIFTKVNLLKHGLVNNVGFHRNKKVGRGSGSGSCLRRSEQVGLSSCYGGLCFRYGDEFGGWSDDAGTCRLNQQGTELPQD
jgi:hypothetical protein